MAEDNITLEFNLAEPVSFEIGDFVDDELFGLFFITEEPTPPDCDAQNGAYKYSLRFDKDYYVWGNKVLQLTYAGEQTNLSLGISRKETTFTITDKLEVHIQEIIRNLYALGYTIVGTDWDIYCKYGYCIDGETRKVLRRVITGESVAFEFVEAPDWWEYTIPTFHGVTEALSMVMITYDGANIIDALTSAICEPYACEWWVMNNFLCLGKCEFGEKIDFRMDKDSDEDVINVETMRPSRNDNEFANRLYVYGGTKNIPDTYRKELIFTLTDVITEGDTIKCSDSAHILRRAYIDPYYYKSENVVQGTRITPGGSMGSSVVLDMGEFTIPYPLSSLYTEASFRISLASDCGSRIETFIYAFSIYIGEQEIPGTAVQGQVTSVGAGGSLNNININIGRVLDEQLYLRPDLPVTLRGTVRHESGAYQVLSGTASGKAIFELPAGDVFCYLQCNTPDGKTFTAEYEENGNEQFIYFTPLAYEWGGLTPEDFKPGFTFFLQPSGEDYHGIDISTIPSAWYSYPEGDINSNRSLGERRLCLPKDTPYIGREMPNEKVVERVVVFDDIFPKCGLRICGLHAVKGSIDWETYHDGSTSSADAVNYFIALERITPDGDVPFPFNNYDGHPDMRIAGEGLQIKFLSEDEAKKYGPLNGSYDPSYMLAGLTFNVGINESGSLFSFTDDETGEQMYGFQIERTDEYKTYLPNEIMKPSKGDAIVLSGWNPNYMADLGLIDSAEEELKRAGEKYDSLLEFEQFTFDCTMMSDWAQGHELSFGQKVWVFNKSLPLDTDPTSATYNLRVKDSRVIGYELKLDIPEDTPVYTIGETEAYSRLKALERELNAQSKEGSSSGVISDSGSGGGGGGTTSVAWGEEPNTGTEVDLRVGDVTKRLLKTEALEFTPPAGEAAKKITVQDNADFTVAMMALFPLN